MGRNYPSIIAGLVVILGASMICDSASAQWRGRYVRRSGPFHEVERYHWGNGLTPAGATFLSEAVTTIVPILPSLIGAGRDMDDPTGQTRASFQAPEDYVREQRRANDLLARTARLVDESIGAAEVPQQDLKQGEVNVEKLQQLYKTGNNPFVLQQNN